MNAPERCNQDAEHSLADSYEQNGGHSTLSESFPLDVQWILDDDENEINEDPQLSEPFVTTADTECQIIQAFVDGYLPTAAQDQQDTVWISTAIDVAQSDSSSPAALLSLRALSMARVGYRCGDPRLVREGHRMYGRALNALQQALYTPKHMTSDSTIATCRFLECYEMFGNGAMAEPNLSWMTHQDGLERILRAGGLKKSEDIWDHALFQGLPDLIMRKAIWSRKSAGLSLLRRYSRTSSPEKILGNQVWLHGFRLASMLQRLDFLTSTGVNENTAPHIVRQVNHFVTLDHQLQTWYHNFTLACSTPISYETDDGYKLYRYSSLRIGQLILVCWTLRLIISSTIDKLRRHHYQAMQDPTKTASIATTLGEYNAENRRQLAFEIVRSAPFFCQRTNGAAGIIKLAFSYDLAMRELKDHPKVIEENPWLRNTGVPLLFDRETLSPGLPPRLDLRIETACALHRFLKIYYGYSKWDSNFEASTRDLP